MISRLLTKAHLLRCPLQALLQRTSKVRLSRAFAGALHLGPFSTAWSKTVCQRTVRILLLFSVATFLLSGCIDLLQQTKTKPKNEDDLQSVKQQVEELRAERADRNVTVDDLRVRIQLVAGEVDSTRYAMDQRLADLDSRFKAIEERLENIEDKLEALDSSHTNPKEGSADDLWEEAQKYYNAKSYADAILKYEELKTGFPDYKGLPRLYLQQARSFSKMGKTKEAKLFYNKVKELYPKSREAKEAESELKTLK